MRATLSIALVVASLAGAPPAVADNFDGSSPLICAATQAMECVAGEDCLRGLAAEFGLPTFLRIDFAQKAVIGPARVSPVLHMEATERQLLLQGTELGLAWSIVLDKATGELIATLVDRHGAIVTFGACTVP